MRTYNFKAIIKAALRVACILPFAAGAAFGQSVTATASGTVDVGASVTTAALTLTAGASAIDAGSVTVTGVSAPFTVDPTGCAGGVAAGGSCTMNVTFSPTATGSFTDSVTVSATSGSIAVAVAGSPVTLSGTGTVPTVTAANPLVFVDPGPGVQSAPLTVTLNNVADTQLTFTTVFSSTAYSVAAGGTCLSPIVLGGATQTCTINVVFTPPTGLVVDPSATLTIMSAFGTATPTQVAQISLVDTNPGALTAGATVEVELTAVATSVTLNDGSTVPMWGYQCGANSLASCRPLNPAVSLATSAIKPWSPVVITALAGQNLTIDLTNNLSFTPPSSTLPNTNSPNNIPTSLVIVGQLGGGLGTSATYTASPTHANQSVTWSTVGNSTGAQFTPPPQGPRVQSFATEVVVGTTQRLIWNNLRPGTYLLESGTHPSIQGPMGLYGILVVTTAPTVDATGKETAAGTAYPGVPYDADVPLLLSEIDPAQNNAVNKAVNTVGFSETAVITLKDSLSAVILTLSNGVPVNAGTGYAVGDAVTFAPGVGSGGGVGATAQVAHVTSTGAIIDFAVTNPGAGYTSVPTNGIITSTNGTGAAFTAVLSLAGDLCGTGSSACYPPAVNFTPLYYTINGVAFNKTNSSASTFSATPATLAPLTGPGSVLVRFVNAGLRMHVPSIVGSLTNKQMPAGAAPTVTGGFSIIAEDGNPLPGLARVQNEVFMAAGKTYDVMINATPACIPVLAGQTCTTPALPVYDRELSLSGNAIARDAGMLAYIGINGSAIPAASISALAGAMARDDTYPSVITCAVATPQPPCKAVTVSDPSKGLIANDTNVYGVRVLAAPAGGALALNADGTFIYTPNPGTTSDTFTYCANGTVTGTTCSSNVWATVHLNAAAIEAASGITVNPITYTSNVATYLNIKSPGVLSVDKDALGYPLSVNIASVGNTAGPGTLTLAMDSHGGFNASVTASGTYTFTYKAQNSQGTVSSSAATVTLIFPQPSNLAVTVLDGYDKITQISDYRWIIEEDKTFYINPNCTTTTTTPPAGCPSTTTTGGVPPTFGVNFHTSHMEYVAQGCTGQLSCEGGQTVVDPNTGIHNPAVCDVGDGVCRLDNTGNGFTVVMPGQVYLDPTKRYYISVLPGDAANPFGSGYAGAPDCTTAGHCGHGMGGAPITFGQTAVTILSQPSPYPTAKLSIFVFEDDFPLNGEHDGGGGIDVLSPFEPGLGGFQLHLWDAFGGNGDFTGQMTYDMFNQPLTNSLDGTIDPSTGKNACPITQVGINNPGTNATSGPLGSSNDASTTAGITGMIVTCPKYESDGTTLSPLAGQAVVSNLMPGRWGVIATPAADRIARGEEWLQTNTLDGQKAHDSFTRIGEPSFFQEYGPASYHVAIGFANPKIINDRLAGVCNGTDPNITGTPCTNTITGRVTGERLSRTPDERLYSSGSHDAFYWTQCFVSVGDADGEDFAFTKCNADGTFKLTGLPDGDWRITTFDQWNDQLVDGLSTPVRLDHTNPSSGNIGDIAATQWQTDLYTQTFIDDDKSGVSKNKQVGIPFANVAVRLRDGSLENLLVTDFTGTANFNETFPLFSWYTVETDTTRYKNTGTHVVYDAGGPADGTLTTCGGTVSGTGYPPCGTSTIGKFLANTAEQTPVPTNLRVPGAVYCNDADCGSFSIATGPEAGGSSGPGGSTGRIDPPWAGVEGWQGFPGQNSFLEFGKTPYVPGENGGIKGHVIYASTRPFDDPYMLVQTQWEPLVPNVTINLYQEGTAPDGTQSLTLIDTTQTSSWDKWAQGFRSDGVPNMNCPGQTTADLFYFTLFNQPNYLNLYDAQHGGPAAPALPNNSQFKCYDGMHNWNQIQPAPYDGMYQFPSVTGLNPTTGKPTGTNCTKCTTNPDSTDPYRFGSPMLPAGKYVVEVVLPPGYELVKEEDKNILIGDNFIAPVTQQFGGLGNIFIIPDQAQVGSAFNANNAQNPTQSFGASPINGIVPAFVPEPLWPCVGETRIVPDYISLYPQTHQVAPFAGATRNLCDRKEVTLTEQMGAIAKFFIYTSTHIASKFTGGITDDYTSEFDPFSPVFGEKFAPPNMPISIKDWSGNEVSRVYSDQWGSYNGLTYSTWEVNPPNPTGYAPTMMVFCMNDSGSGPTPDPLFNPAYSQFCYELPFMPGATAYLDTPVVPTSAFAGAGYNNVDCAYPNATPAIKEVDGDTGVGPWVSAPGKTITITALGDQMVNNNAYMGPSATTAPYNQKTILRHYGFGSAPSPNCNVGSGSPAACPGVTVGGIPLHGVTWNDTTITGQVQANVPPCAIQQQAQYGGSPALCGELVITAANGKQSIDAVTVTIGGKAPTHVLASGTIQSAIDTALPGDLIIVDPTCTTTMAVACTTAGATKTNASHKELLLMWKPVRLQGVGAASSIIDANAHPAGKLDPWRRQVVCLFGLTPTGTPNGGDTACGAGWSAFSPTSSNPQIDRLPLEAVVGWTASLNGNLAELLQEPTLMGALEGAAITVLSKGANFPPGSDPFQTNATIPGTFPTGTTLLQNVAGVSTDHCQDNPNPFPSNFECNPSSIDGLGITDSSQGGGGIFVHAWGHNLQIANNRIYNNAGTFGGGVSVGQGEFAPSYIQGSALNAAPGSCETSPTAGVQLPYCQNMHVNMHNNYVALNSSTGDELFSATPAGTGGVTICTGADYYKFNYNWVCGNLSTGDGGGVGHLGFISHGDIEYNTILFNQSLNPTIPANGGGIVVMGTPDVDPPCGTTTDADCVPPVGSVAPSDGMGPELVINANLIMGNAAEAGSGGGLRFQNVNGTEVIAFPTTPSQWYHAKVTNNIIADNVAGWDGAGISLQDALNVDIVNNTIVSNSTTASAGILFTTIGGPLASAQGTNCTTSSTTSCPQVAGLVSIQNNANFVANFPATIVCPPGHYAGTTASNGSCRRYSYPLLANDVFWQNSAYYIGVGALSPQYQQNVVTLYNAFTATPAASQPQADATTTNGNGVIITGGTGACVPRSYWDIGARGDTGPANHASGITLAPTYSVLTDASDYPGRNNIGSNPDFMSQYCDGSRTAPEFGSAGWAVPPGIADATVPNPAFNLTPVATVDEGNNWINLRWGPLSMTNPVTGATLGNYALAPLSPAVDAIPTSSTTFAVTPRTDFFGNPRPDPAVPGRFDVGAVELQGTGASALANVTGGPLAFGNVVVGTTSASRQLVLHNTGSATLTGINIVVTAPFARAAAGGNCGATLAAGSTCTINVVFSPTAAGAAAGTVTITANVPVSGSPVQLTGTGVARVVSATLTPTSWTVSQVRNCPGTTMIQIILCMLDPAQTFTLTNSGNVNLTGVGPGVLGGTAANVANYAIIGLLSNCGNATHTTLTPGATCVVTVQFRPLTAQLAGLKAATISVTDLAGTQTSNLNGTAQ
jgi:Abnormal spindle-like microcephaly-assoc'd, ASPM-SPD-2-Hydin/Bacterial Ig domain